MKKFFINKKKKGFTLAEALIAMAIIGVVAAISMPTLLQRVNKIVLENRRKVETRKLTQSIEVMGALNTLAGHKNTLEFVNELKNHLLIPKICDPSKIEECWAYEQLTLIDGSIFNLASAGDGDTLFHMGGLDPDGDEADYSSQTVSFLIGDGTYFIIGYNTKCKTDGTEAKNCFVAAFDANASKAPNKVGEDVFLINSNQFGSSNAEGGGSIGNVSEDNGNTGNGNGNGNGNNGNHGNGNNGNGNGNNGNHGNGNGNGNNGNHGNGNNGNGNGNNGNNGHHCEGNHGNGNGNYCD